MNSFLNNYLEKMPATQNILRSVRLLGEYKGKQDLYMKQIPQALETLKQTAIIQSTESSNRIEGVTAPIARIKALVADKTTPQNRSEQEIAGYRDVLTTIHASYDAIPVNNNIILQFHRDLFKYSAAGDAGRWKPVDNEITEEHSDGAKVVRFLPTSAFATPAAMGSLENEFRRRWQSDEVDRLVLIPAFVFDFLSVHPFRDGNGRMARLLSLLLLYQAGYEVGRFISLEKLVEESRESYYESLQKSSAGWHEGKHNLLPWIEYFLGMLTAGYREFETRVGELTATRGAKTTMILDALRGLPETFQIGDLERVCPNVSREMIRKVFGTLKTQGKLVCEGRGTNAPWRKTGAF
jgi:Fic family protein